MKTKLILCISIFGMFIVGCKKEKSFSDFMVGSWQTTYLKIDYKTFQNSDSTSVYEDKFENNPELIAQSKYNADGTFTSWFVNKKGGKISESKGTWSVKKDSLTVEFFYNNRDMKVSYFLEETPEGFIAKSKYDWDEDGKNDDLLTMKTKRVVLK